MRLDSGNVLAARMNSHRHQWNGTICSQPQSWNCGAVDTFRASYCDRSEPRCFHIDVFKSNAPHFLTPDSSVILAIQQQPRLLDEQLLVFYGGRFGAQQGIASGDYAQTLFGFYRVKHATVDTTRTQYRLVVEPHADGYVLFPRTYLRSPTFRPLPGVAYLKQIRAKALKDAIDEALEAAESPSNTDGWTAEHQRRLLRAAEALPIWLQQAEQAFARLPEPSEAPRISAAFGQVEGTLAAKLRGLKITAAPPESPVQLPAVAEPDSKAVPLSSIDAELAPAQDGPDTEAGAAEDVIAPKASEDSQREQAISDVGESDDGRTVEEGMKVNLLVPAMIEAGEPAASKLTVGDRRAHAVPNGVDVSVPALPSRIDDATEALVVHAVPEPLGRQLLADQFGSLLVDALSVAFITKGLVILTGAPGAGKSWIASRLLDDEARDRTVIVPVASTWRGREDLLGYVNPINGSFEATEFTHFLCKAQDAWEAGDKRARLVIFEEFNLSQPEHWLSDLLVRLEYDPEHLADRTIHLGGNEISGRRGRPCSVVLVPNLRFAATLNNDHTVKPLSPRVLDRAALIEITSSGRAALARAGVALGEDVEDVIDELNELLEPRGAAFSVRSARSLQRALESTETTGLSLARALDLVLTQEVLSRVRLMAGDPRDEQLLAHLQTWTQKPGCAELTGCAARIGGWADLISAGRDVFQA